MRSKTSSLPSAETTSEERIARLASFISDHIATGATNCSGVCVIARSIDSPVAKAVAIATSDTCQVPVRTLLASVDRKALEDKGLRWEIRVMRSPRLLDAHEQLSVGGASWHGDSLRRDPDKRDLFEQFHAGGGEQQAWTELSFARLWALAEPVIVAAPAYAAIAEEAGKLAAINETGDAQAENSLQR